MTTFAKKVYIYIPQWLEKTFCFHCGDLVLLEYHHVSHLQICIENDILAKTLKNKDVI